jgi:hypothetical protein
MDASGSGRLSYRLIYQIALSDEIAGQPADQSTVRRESIS